MLPLNANPEQLLPSVLQGEKPNAIVTINSKNANQLMQLLMNVYQDPITATVREIISNAIDATKLLPASQRQPIDIHLPSLQEPFFAVTDYAGGMSTQEVKDIYCNYHIQPIDGIGAKAPFSYTTNFMVTTVKNQQETTCLINLQQGRLYTNKTAAANGTMVKIPLSKEWDIEKFSDAIKTYAVMPIPDIKFTGLDYFQKYLQPYGAVIPCGTIQVENQNLSVYWHCHSFTSTSQISGKQFFNSFMDIYAVFNTFNSRSEYLPTYIDVSAAIDGFQYQLSRRHYQDSEFIIALQPGMVNFSTRRDQIVTDDKRQQLLNAFYQQIAASFFKTIKTIGLRKMVNTEMFPWAVRACGIFHTTNFKLVQNDPTLLKQLFTNQQQVNLWNLTPRPLALLDLQENQATEIEFIIGGLHQEQQLLDVVKKRFYNRQQRPSLFNLEFDRDFDSWKDLDRYANRRWDPFCQEGVINVLTDLNDFSLVKKIIYHRKKIMQSTLKTVPTNQENYCPNILLLFQEPQQQVEPVIKQMLAGIPVTINYVSRQQTEQLVKTTKTLKRAIPQLHPFKSLLVDNAWDFYQICRHSDPFKTRINSGSDLTLGLIFDNQPATKVITKFEEEILKIIFLFQSKITLQVNLYRAATLKSYNMKQIQQQNDLVLCLHDFSTKNLQHYLSKLNLPARKITLSNHTQDLLLLLLYWSQICGQQQTNPDDYHSLRLTLEKLLQLHLLRHDPQLLDFFRITTLRSLSKVRVKRKSKIISTIAASYASRPYIPLNCIFDDFTPLYQFFNNAVQSGMLDVQSIKTTQVQADIKFIQQYWQTVRIQKQQQTKAPLLDFNSYIIHYYLTK